MNFEWKKLGQELLILLGFYLLSGTFCCLNTIDFPWDSIYFGGQRLDHIGGSTFFDCLFFELYCRWQVNLKIGFFFWAIFRIFTLVFMVVKKLWQHRKCV
jgi:hypothetical protein